MFELARMTFASIWRAFRPTQKMWHKVPRLLTYGNSEMFFVVFWATRLVEFRHTGNKNAKQGADKLCVKKNPVRIGRGEIRCGLLKKKSMRTVKEGREGGRRQKGRIGPAYLLPALKISILKYYARSYICWALATCWTPAVCLHFNSAVTVLRGYVWLLCPRMEGNMTT